MGKMILNNKSVRIGAVEIKPAERACVDLPVADLYTHASLNMPVQVINGKRPGPTLFVSAAIHGDSVHSRTSNSCLMNRSWPPRLP